MPRSGLSTVSVTPPVLRRLSPPLAAPTENAPLGCEPPLGCGLGSAPPLGQDSDSDQTSVRTRPGPDSSSNLNAGLTPDAEPDAYWTSTGPERRCALGVAPGPGRAWTPVHWPARTVGFPPPSPNARRMFVSVRLPCPVGPVSPCPGVRSARVRRPGVRSAPCPRVPATPDSPAARGLHDAARGPCGVGCGSHVILREFPPDSVVAAERSDAARRRGGPGLADTFASESRANTGSQVNTGLGPGAMRRSLTSREDSGSRRCALRAEPFEPGVSRKIRNQKSGKSVKAPTRPPLPGSTSTLTRTKWSLWFLSCRDGATARARASRRIRPGRDSGPGAGSEVKPTPDASPPPGATPSG